ncbi:nitroreductase family protein [Haloplasma contractile]|uniref:56-dimethylbenzimidazole synthase protein n=1 Tax=Haloplasma contractile SSD-17B TaxID=1033810 RepID=U2E8N8_9MOLU|nr:nitroreductase family protein [Haloplasma contractile]ERJ11508.1 56-dimethylbenzimidazole synthase protein [Haloplasma contractile SSD-17B]
MLEDEQRLSIDKYFDSIKEYNDQKLIETDISTSVIESIIKSAGTAPSGANQQPWTYVIIEDKGKKQRILNTVKHPNTCSKNYSYLIALFKQNYGLVEKDGSEAKIKHYYPQESTSLSAGFLLAAFQYVGIKIELLPVEQSLRKELNRSSNEVPFLLIGIDNKSIHDDVLQLAENYFNVINRRRSTRKYSSQKFNKELLQKAIQCTNTILGYYVNEISCELMIVDSEEKKQQIRTRAEANEKRLYEELITDEWRRALKPLKTDWRKQHLTDAPYLLVVFFKKGAHSELVDSKTLAGIATGIMIQTVHRIGLSTLTYTPSPMQFLNEILTKPISNIPFMVLPIGFCASDYEPPHITRKSLQQYLVKI